MSFALLFAPVTSTSVPDPAAAQATTPADSTADPNAATESPSEASEVTIVFVTATPTFTGPTAGFITLDASGNVIGPTADAQATDTAAQATDAGVTENPTTQVAAATESTDALATQAAATEQTQPEAQATVTVTQESESIPSGTTTTTVFASEPTAPADGGESVAAPPAESPTAAVSEPQPAASEPTPAPSAPAPPPENTDGGLTVAPVSPGVAAADPTATTAPAIPSGLILGQVISAEPVTVTETVTTTVTAA